MKATAKLASTLAALVGVARAKETTVSKVEAALIEAREQVASANREHDAAERAYESGLLDESAAALAKLLDRKASAVIERDRAAALVKALENRLAEARAAESRAEREAVHRDAVAKADAIKARFADEYRHHAGAIRNLLRDLAEAETARLQANPLQQEFGRIEPVEDAIRGAQWEPEEIVSSEVVTLWCMDGRTEPLPADKQRDVRPRGNSELHRGLLPSTASGQCSPTAGQWECTQRQYRRVVVREASRSSTADSLLQAVHLPGLHHLAEHYVTSETWRSPDTALAHLSRERPADPVIARPVVERFELIPEPPAEREAVVPFPKREPDPAPRTPSARETRAQHTPSKIMAADRLAG
ncbi:hypothetical protein [Methylobacterium haplocladii]|uniref:Uncharacterized protein n=1 Tax=Methylobacterium haplocladii TaxID=1176176 RepID=A0A512IPE3_9HYPH|nr:hypothetical protein [Methylobacterium haplocladii]GEO99508.1 hypothetical protein MHA02_18960 [Methylobacterium haplocladii]GJD84562.1 hypothetical protein HPGCJGGD_2440 [Methylobacterium haplocladii]GLS59753.1 hypothetical protein GCM10007887_24250 [Methylobacterium haplocladii]